MTILRAIELADLARANEIEPELKLYWLSTIDGMVQRDVLDDNKPGGAPPDFRWSDVFGPIGPAAEPVTPEEADYAGYGPDTDINSTELLIKAPYDEIYPLYLEMRIDLENNEIERYNNDAKLFDEAWKRFAWQYNRTHRSRTVPFVRF